MFIAQNNIEKNFDVLSNNLFKIEKLSNNFK